MLLGFFIGASVATAFWFGVARWRITNVEARIATLTELVLARDMST